MNIETRPENAIAAVIYPDPYPYYAELAQRKPLYFDETLGMWVASSAAAVEAVLRSAVCRVRPTSEPIPKGLLGTPAADIFGRLVRMNDGAGHHRAKQVISATLGGFDQTRVAAQSCQWAEFLAKPLHLRDGSTPLTDFAFQLPVYVMASLLGVPGDRLTQVTQGIADFVRCFAAGSSPELITRGGEAAGALLNLFRSLVSSQLNGAGENLLGGLARQFHGNGLVDGEVLVANGIGFLSQAYEATAGLIGNTLLALAARPEIRRRVVNNPELLIDVILEVLRYDAPVQNTRRYVAQAGMVAGQAMQAGDTVLVVLAAANRDPIANSDPERFDLARPHRRSFTFGFGGHQCPGEVFAVMIARAGVERLLTLPIDFDDLAQTVTYRPSVNVRIPMFS